MGTKQLFIGIVAMTFLIVSSIGVGSEGSEPQAKPQPYEYTGTIKVMSESAHILTVQTQKGPIDFHYQRHGRKECAGFRQLAVGDSVKVISGESKKLSEATCITKASPAKAPK
jgi:hypothetical protein